MIPYSHKFERLKIFSVKINGNVFDGIDIYYYSGFQSYMSYEIYNYSIGE